MGGVGSLGQGAAARGPGHHLPGPRGLDTVAGLLAGDHGVGPVDDHWWRQARGRGPGGPRGRRLTLSLSAPASAAAVPVAMAVSVPVPVHGVRSLGRLGGHQELPAGQLLGQPDLVDVHAPGHHHHGRGQSRRSQPE